jgi:hypothetical protein
MGILTADMKRVVEEQRLGFAATVCADGSPSLSPKGTMVVLDDDHIMFGEIRSPNTIENLRANPAMEINFVDPFARTGYRFKGTASIVERGSDEFEALHAQFGRWGALTAAIKRIVKLRVERALPVTSPAYDIGVTEAELRRTWMAHFAAIQPDADTVRKKA